MALDRDDLVDVLSDFADYFEEQIVRPAVNQLTQVAVQIDTQKPKRTTEFWGEYIREAAVLILVFLPLDLLIPRLFDPDKAFRHMWVWFVGTLLLSVGLLVLGIKVERS